MRAPFPRPPGRQRLWTSIRIFVRFEVRDVAATAGVKLATARRFLRELRRRGLIRRMNPRVVPTLGRPAVWCLVKDVGPRLSGAARA